MPPLFENVSFDTLNSEQKPSLKKPVDRANQSGRSAGQSAMILKFTGRVEKILTGSISGGNSSNFLFHAFFLQVVIKFSRRSTQFRNLLLILTLVRRVRD